MLAIPLFLLSVAAAPCVVGGAGQCATDEYCAAAFDLSDASCPASGTCTLIPGGGELPLSLPVPAGGRVFCSQGVLQAGGHTHAACSDDRRFAIDLASSAFEAPHLVLASADGVAYGWGDCRSTDLNHDPPDATCNLGLGNVVRVQHAGGLFTQYAHLSAILIIPGEVVKRGAPIGVEGNTGAAGQKHIHFSLHVGSAAVLKPAPSIPMRRLRVRGGRGVGTIDTLTMRCSEADADGGPAPSIAYVSDNVARKRPARIGFTPPQRYLLESAAGKIFDPATRPVAIGVLRAHPDEALARYWLAVALELDGNRGAARALFTALAQSPLGPDWVRRWSWLRLADLSVAEKKPAEARQAVARALAGAPPTDIDFRRFADYVRRAIEWMVSHPPS